jgi:ABC-type multidrug transport system ATPase subunit
MDFCGTYPKAKREEKARSLLRDLDIEDLAEFLPNSLSTGHQQCAAIARAMANDPPIILADEPTGNLDSKTGELVIHIFKKLVSQGKTVIMVTHDRKLAQNADRILVIKDGILIKETLSNKFFDLSEQLFSKIIEKSEVIHRKSGELIFHSLPETTWFCIVDQGSVELKDDHLLHPNYSKMVFHSGELIFPADPSNYFAVTDCEVILIPNANVLQLSDSEIQEMVAVIYPQGNFEEVSNAT